MPAPMKMAIKQVQTVKRNPSGAFLLGDGRRLPVGTYPGVAEPTAGISAVSWNE